MFWVGFGIGVMIGAILGIMCIALVIANHRSEKDNKEQTRRELMSVPFYASEEYIESIKEVI